MQNQPHIHLVDTFPKVKRVFVDDKEVDHAFYADTKKGVVRYYPQPLKLHKYGKRVVSRTLHGQVRLEFVNDGAM